MSFSDIKKGLANLRKHNSVGSDNPKQPSPPNSSIIENKVLFQGFEWYCPSDGKHWDRTKYVLPMLKSLGVNQIWLPPGCKAGWQGSNGYDVYDQYDLGEFDQKGSIRTKWGNKQQLLQLAQAAQHQGIGLCWDGVLNHKCSADYTEKCQAVKVDKDDRTKQIGKPHEIEVWTGYDFAARADKYSSFKYHWYHFSGTDWEANLKTNNALYKFVGSDKPGWASDVDDSLGNYDYLMGNDLDFSHPETRADMHAWGEWIVQEVGLSGFRLDAVKHFSQSYLQEWIHNLDSKYQQRLFFVGEYWRGDLKVLGPVIEKFKGRLHLFDVELAGNMSKLSQSAPHGDLSKVFHNTLTKHYPAQAVTFVLNHDTQPRYERDHHVVPIMPWFIPLAYAIILLRESPSYPCVFYGDLYGTCSPDPAKLPHLAQQPSCFGTLSRMMMARKLWAYGPMQEYFDDASCCGFTRSGLQGDSGSKSAGVAIVLNIANRWAGKRMNVGQNHAGETWTDLLGFAWGDTEIDEDGWTTFPVSRRSVGVWVHDKAIGRVEVERMEIDTDIYKGSAQPT